jgi:hypothetical protein
MLWNCDQLDKIELLEIWIVALISSLRIKDLCCQTSHHWFYFHNVVSPIIYVQIHLVVGANCFLAQLPHRQGFIRFCYVLLKYALLLFDMHRKVKLLWLISWTNMYFIFGRRIQCILLEGWLLWNISCPDHKMHLVKLMVSVVLMDHYWLLLSTTQWKQFEVWWPHGDQDVQ